jgi:hypothetical protein
LGKSPPSFSGPRFSNPKLAPNQILLLIYHQYTPIIINISSFIIGLKVESRKGKGEAVGRITARHAFNGILKDCQQVYVGAVFDRPRLSENSRKARLDLQSDDNVLFQPKSKLKP